MGQPAWPPTGYPDREPVRSLFVRLCRVPNCPNEARYYATPQSVHPTLCALHDVEYNGGCGERSLDRSTRSV